jgi:hypothetical protein
MPSPTPSPFSTPRRAAQHSQNLFGAFIYNTPGIPIAAGVPYPATESLLNLMLAGALRVLSSFTAVSNANRLRGLRPPRPASAKRGELTVDPASRSSAMTTPLVNPVRLDPIGPIAWWFWRVRS